MSAKKYHSKAWLKLQYVNNKRSIPEIARECGVQEMTIYRYLRKFELMRNSK